MRCSSALLVMTEVNWACQLMSIPIRLTSLVQLSLDGRMLITDLTAFLSEFLPASKKQATRTWGRWSSLC